MNKKEIKELKTPVEKGFTITEIDKEIKIDINGALSPSESIQLPLIALHMFLKKSYETMLRNTENNDEETDLTIRAVLYDQAVIAFSALIHDFFPEAEELKAKDDKFEAYIQMKLEESEKANSKA